MQRLWEWSIPGMFEVDKVTRVAGAELVRRTVISNEVKEVKGGSVDHGEACKNYKDFSFKSN